MKTFIKLLLLLFVALPAWVIAAAQVSITVADGTDTNQYVPVCGYYYDNGNAGTNTNRRTRGQMIYPESMLKAAGLEEGREIRSLTFYSNSGIHFSTESGNGVLTIQLGKSSLGSFTGNNWTTFSGTPVTGTVTPKNGDTQFTVNFTTPFKYMGGDILVDVVVSAAGTRDNNNNRTYFDGVETDDNQSRYYYRSNNNPRDNQALQEFLPKATFEFVPIISVDKTELNFNKVGVDFTSEQTVTVTNETAANADLSWTFDNNKFSTTATAEQVPAGGKVEIPVTF